MQPGRSVVERHAGAHWRAVLHHVQVVAPEIDDALAACVCHVGVANVPFTRDVQSRHVFQRAPRASRSGIVSLSDREALAHALAGDAAANRKEPRRQRVHAGPAGGFVAVSPRQEVEHRPTLRSRLQIDDNSPSPHVDG